MPDQSGQQAIVVKNRSASGGVNTYSFPLDIRDDQVVDMTNGLAATPGVVEVRGGSSIVATGVTYGPIKAMVEFMPGTTSELLVIAPGATYPLSGHLTLWKWDGTGAVFTLVGTLTGCTSATLPVEMVVGLDLNYGGTQPTVVRINTPQQIEGNYIYGGAGISLASGTNKEPTTGMFPISFIQGRAFGAGNVGTSKGKVFYSDAASWTFTGWGTSQSFAFGGGNRQDIIAIRAFRKSNAVIFMSDRVEALVLEGDPILVNYPSGASTGVWAREIIDTRIGCGSRLTVKTVGEDLFFLDQYANVRSLNQTITDNAQGTKGLPVSAPIQSWIERVNPAAIANASAESYDRYYAIALPIDQATFPSHTFLFDTINKAWYGPQVGNFSTVNVMAVATLNGATSSADRNPTLYLGGSATAQGEVRRALVGTSDDGASIQFQLTTKRYDYGGIEAKKQPRRERVYAVASAGATLQIEARKDGANFQTVGYLGLAGNALQLPLTLDISLTGQGVVEGVFSLEDQFENPADLQFRYTATVAQALQLIGHTEQVHLKNIDWTPT